MANSTRSTATETPPRRFRPRQVLFAVAIVAAVLGLGEVVARIAWPDVRSNTFFSLGVTARAADPLVEDRELFWARPGMQEKWERKIRAYRGENLVLGFGGSIAAGGFLGELAVELRPDCPDMRLIAMATAGYTTHHARILFDRYAGLNPPRLVIVCNAFNDHALDRMNYRDALRLNRHWSRDVLAALNRSQLFAVYRRALRVRTAQSLDPAPKTAVVPPEHYRENLVHIIERCGEWQTSVVLVTEAMPVRETEQDLAPYFAVLRELADRYPHVYLADTLPAFAEARRELGVSYLPAEAVQSSTPPTAEENPLFDDPSCHPSARGRRLYVRTLADLIRANRLLCPDGGK